MRMQLASTPAAAREPSAGMRLAGQAGGSGASSNDFWDVGNPGMVGPQLSPDHGFNEIVAVRSSGPGLGRAALYGVLLLTLSVAGYFAYQMVFNQKDPVDHALELYAQARLLAGLDPVPDASDHVRPRPRPRTKGLAPAPATVKTPQKKPVKAVAGNPYWSLPNKLLGPDTELNRTWTAEEEETWRAGLAHKYAYQRYKTVQEVRERRLRGSEKILWDALQDKKFWMRGFAAVGIAEFNIQISLQSLETALGTARSEVVADFFERFIKKPSAGQAFVLRQVVRLLDEKGRLIALAGIANSKDPLRELYLAAATKDPGRRVHRWIGSYLRDHPMNPDHYNDLLEVVTGERDGTELLAGMVAAQEAPQQKRQKALRLATDEDLDKELAEFETAGGGVEIYDEAVIAPEQHADPEQFEYQDAQGTKPLGMKLKNTLPRSGNDGVLSESSVPAPVAEPLK